MQPNLSYAGLIVCIYVSMLGATVHRRFDTIYVTFQISCFICAILEAGSIESGIRSDFLYTSRIIMMSGFITFIINEIVHNNVKSMREKIVRNNVDIQVKYDSKTDILISSYTTQPESKYWDKFKYGIEIGFYTKKPKIIDNDRNFESRQMMAIRINNASRRPVVNLDEVVVLVTNGIDPSLLNELRLAHRELINFNNNKPLRLEEAADNLAQLALRLCDKIEDADLTDKLKSSISLYFEAKKLSES